jgi:hypothetical protein
VPPPPPDVSPPFAPPPIAPPTFAPPPLLPPSPRATLVPPPSVAAVPAVPLVAVPAPSPTRSGGRAPEAPASVWHVRVGGGATFGVLGMDPPDPGPSGGADVGVTFARGVGVDAFYRADVVRFRLADDPDLTKDGGTLHHVGVKLTYETPRTPGRPLGIYAARGRRGRSRRLRRNEQRPGVHGERVSRPRRLLARPRRRGVPCSRATWAGTSPRTRDVRWVYTVSPVVFLQFDL